MSGTSVASAVVAGVAAEVWAMNNPDLSGAQIKSSLLQSATMVDSFEGRVRTEGRLIYIPHLKRHLTINIFS